MKCPRDNNILTSKQGFHGCNSCHGIFVPIDSIPTLKEAKIEKITKLPLSNFNCLKCQSQIHILMHKGMEIDICSSCKSIWLDRDEKDLLKEESSWWDIDPISGFIDFLPSNKSTSSCDTGGGLEILGEIIGSLLDGL
ncbi:zf-TFIIB domain-containing protein [Microbulbifer sp. TRSA002]|uniref:zf-TFIIB domain-containing protein n=1 Tax=Microbulbifer sp. TRSA002 TaxID=3243382 RepID=UPI0040394411